MKRKDPTFQAAIAHATSLCYFKGHDRSDVQFGLGVISSSSPGPAWRVPKDYSKRSPIEDTKHTHSFGVLQATLHCRVMYASLEKTTGGKRIVRHQKGNLFGAQTVPREKNRRKECLEVLFDSLRGNGSVNRDITTCKLHLRLQIPFQ